MRSALILNNAANFAVKAHDGQFRKDGITPYCVHPLRVGGLLAQFNASDTVILCGLWHDILEDRPDFRDGLLAELSRYCTHEDDNIIKILESLCKPDLKEGNRETRNALFRKQIIEGGNASIFVKICDRIDNVMDSDGLGDMAKLYVVHETGQLIDSFLSIDGKHVWDNALYTLMDSRSDIIKKNGW